MKMRSFQQLSRDDYRKALTGALASMAPINQQPPEVQLPNIPIKDIAAFEDGQTVGSDEMRITKPAYTAGQLGNFIKQLNSGHLHTTDFSMLDGTANREVDYGSSAYQEMVDTARREFSKVAELRLSGDGLHRDILVMERQDASGQRWWFLLTARPQPTPSCLKAQKAHRIAPDGALDI